MLLAFILCFSTLPMTAFAQEADAVAEQEEQQETDSAAEQEEAEAAACTFCTAAFFSSSAEVSCVPASLSLTLSTEGSTVSGEEAEAAAAPGEETPADKSTTAATPGTEDSTAGEAPARNSAYSHYYCSHRE